MKISIFDSQDFTEEKSRKFAAIGSYILIADSITMIDNSLWENLLTIDVDNLSEDEVIAICRLAYAHEDYTIEGLLLLENTLSDLRKEKNKKQRNPRFQYLLGYSKSGIKILKRGLRKNQVEFMEHNHIAELKPFIDEKIWFVQAKDFLSDSKKEDVFIKPITESITIRECIFGIDSKIKALFPFTTLDSTDVKDFDFIKIPLWDIPFTDGFSFEKLKYTREDLQAALLPFKANLNKLSEALFSICFIPENIQQIKQLCNEKLSDHIAPVQQSIYESLYIQQLLNQNPQIPKLKLCMGIASAETILNYFEKTKLVLPYVISEIKQQAVRFVDLKASYVFTYMEIPEEIYDDKIEE